MGPGAPGNPRVPSSPLAPKGPCWPLGPSSPSAPYKTEAGIKLQRMQPIRSKPTKIMQTTTTAARCLIFAFKELKFTALTAAPGWPTGPIGPGGPGGPYDTQTSTDALKATVMWSAHKHCGLCGFTDEHVSVTHVLSFRSFGALLTMFSNFTLQWQTCYSKVEFETKSWNEPHEQARFYDAEWGKQDVLVWWLFLRPYLHPLQVHRVVQQGQADPRDPALHHGLLDQ